VVDQGKVGAGKDSQGALSAFAQEDSGQMVGAGVLLGPRSPSNRRNPRSSQIFWGLAIRSTLDSLPLSDDDSRSQSVGAHNQGIGEEGWILRHLEGVVLHSGQPLLFSLFVSLLVGSREGSNIVQQRGS